MDSSAQELLAKQVGRYDESELCKLLLEIILLDSAYQRSTASPDDVLKRYRLEFQSTVRGEAKKQRGESGGDAPSNKGAQKS
jgi:hypothetical protein